jgi:hypothetical protein
MYTDAAATPVKPATNPRPVAAAGPTTPTTDLKNRRVSVRICSSGGISLRLDLPINNPRVGGAT